MTSSSGTLNPPRKVRAGIYLFTLVGSPFVLYARAKGWIGDLELTLWGAEIAATQTLSLVNTRASETPPPDRTPVKKV